MKSIEYYKEKGFEKKQLNQIKLGLEANLDVSKYANPEYTVKSLEELGIEEITKEEYDVDSDNYEYEENYEKFYRMEKE